MAKKKILVNKSELTSLIENVINVMDGKLKSIKPVRSTINESEIQKDRKIIKLTEADIQGLVNKVIKRR